MIVFRLSRSRYSSDLSGRGAELAGGRWNSKGVPLVYTGESRALCTTEVAVHLPLGLIPKDYELVTIEVVEPVAVHRLQPEELPTDWNAYPPANATQELRDRFVAEAKALVLQVPSAVVQGDFNFLLNPRHPDFGNRVKIVSVEPFSFDERLFVR